MSGIIIDKAPERYQRYLTIGDAKGNFDKKKVDTKTEAGIALEEFCKESSAEECQKFLKYLEESGYACRMPSEKSAIERKIEALGHKNKAVRWKAVDALIKDVELHSSPESKARVIDALVNALEDENWYIRVNAALIFAKIAEMEISLDLKEKGLVPLLKAAKDENKKVQRIVIQALAKLVVQVDTSPELKSEVINAFIKALGDGDEEVREKSA